jgi:preprotein translocase subunit Sss1
MEKDSGINAVVVILILGGIGYYIYKQNQTKIETAKNWWSIFN